MKMFFPKGLLSATIAIVITCFFPILANAYQVQTMPNVTNDMLDADYWINKMDDPDKLIMNMDQIAAFNQEIIEKIPGTVYNLADYPTSLTKEQLTAYIDIAFPTDPAYIGTKLVSDSYYQKLERLLNLGGIKDKNPVKYGLSVRRSNLRVFPTADTLSDDPADPGYDLFQNSSLLAAEPVVILQQSSDKKWYFVQMYNCSGWVPVADIAVCDRDTWLDYQNESEFIVVTGSRITLDNEPLLPEVSEIEFTMGTKLPLVAEKDLPDSLRDRRVYQNYVVKFPLRDASGQLEFTMLPIPISNDVTVGYLPYTRSNIIRQVMKMQGERYCWGGMLDGRDCSAMVMELYRTFGLTLARNSNSQAASAGKTLTFNESYSVAYREDLLQNLKPGAILHFPGHEMLYLGKDSGNYYVISDLGFIAETKSDGSGLQGARVRSVTINDLNVLRSSGKTWVECLSVGKQLEETSFTDLANNPNQEIIENLADNYIVQGVSDSQFNPNGKVTRAEFAAMLCRILQLEPDEAAAKAAFNDVSGKWYCGYVGALVKNGYFAGGDNGKFNPNANLNRAEAAAILARIINTTAPVTTEDKLQNYSDAASVPTWAKSAMNTVIASGVMEGKTVNKLAPLDLVTRAEAAVMLDAISNLPVNPAS